MPRGKDKFVYSARVHHATVTSISKGETPRARRRRTTGGSSDKQRAPGFDSSLIDPRLWESARQLCGGDFNRIEIESFESIIVFNTAQQREEWRNLKHVESSHSDER